jgi:transcriptional regulator with XRE-family HTH domain
MRRRNRARGFRLGQLIKQARVAKKLSQAEVARRAGVSQPWLSMVEAGNLILDAFDYARLAEVLKLPSNTALRLAKDAGLEDGPPEAPPPPRKTRGRAGGNR